MSTKREPDAPVVSRRGSVPHGVVHIGAREYIVTGHHVQVFVPRKHGFSTYRTLPYEGPTTRKVLDAFYGEDHK